MLKALDAGFERPLAITGLSQKPGLLQRGMRLQQMQRCLDTWQHDVYAVYDVWTS